MFYYIALAAKHQNLTQETAVKLNYQISKSRELKKINKKKLKKIKKNSKTDIQGMIEMIWVDISFNKKSHKQK